MSFGYRIVRDIEHLLVSLLQGIHLLLEVDVVGGKLGLKDVIISTCDAGFGDVSFASWTTTYLVISLAELLLGVLEGARRKGRNLRTKVTVARMAISAKRVAFREGSRGCGLSGCGGRCRKRVCCRGQERLTRGSCRILRNPF